MTGHALKNIAAVLCACLILSCSRPERAAQSLAQADTAFMHMEYVEAWRLYSGIQSVTHDQLDIIEAETGMMRICQRVSDNVSFYEYRNSILMRLRALEDEQTALTEYENARLKSLERTFRLESAKYYFELEQLSQAEREMSFIERDASLRQDQENYLMSSYMRGIGIGLEPDAGSPQMQRLRSLDMCLRNSTRQGNVSIQALCIGAIAELLLDFGTGNVLSGVSGDMLSRLNASDVSPELLPMQLSLKAMQLAAQQGCQYELILFEKLLARCQTELGQYEEALNTLGKALDMLNDLCRLNYPEIEAPDRLEMYRSDGVIVEQEWMDAVPLATVPECMSGIREQISLVYACLGDKAASDYNRDVYLEIQKNIRLDGRFEARTLLLERSNNRLTVLLYAVIAIIVLLVLFFLLFQGRINESNRRYVDLMKRTVRLCGNILKPIPAGVDPVQSLDATVSAELQALSGARSVRLEGPDGQIRADFGNRRPDRDSRAVTDTVRPYVAAAIANAGELVGQEDRLKEAEKRQYIARMHADSGKRENLVRKTCCLVVAECLPYIDRMRAEIRKLSDMDCAGAEYERTLQYIGELAGYINSYNDLLASWIQMRRGAVNLNVESFPLQPLLDIVSHSSRSFMLKGVELDVQPSDSVVRADRVLTLFMLNTLADNARKFTPAGGRVTVSAVELDDCVELSVQDTGVGLSTEDVRRLTEEKVYDPESIGNGLEGKGSGFGLMNCRGIMDKYRKSDAVFSVCRFSVESVPGSGSRFSFRLPKGIRRALSLLLLIAAGTGVKAQTNPEDSLIVKAYSYAEKAYNCNIASDYRMAVTYADSAFMCLNSDWIAAGGDDSLQLSLCDGKAPAETFWLDAGFATDYQTVLWMRNELAVSALALQDWELYRYNDDAYLKLFRLYFSEGVIEEDCQELQRYNSNLSIAVILLALILLMLLLIRYLVHSRHWLRYRSDLQQVLRTVNRISDLTKVGDFENFDIDVALQRLVDGSFTEMDHLADMNRLVILLSGDGRTHVASHSQGQPDERLDTCVQQCLESGRLQSTRDRLCQAMPLMLESDGDRRLVGVIGFRLEQEPEDTWDIVADMVSSYLAAAVSTRIMRFENGMRDIEQIEEEERRISYEDSRMHVNNLILDNCLSTLKHETVWYPNRISQMAASVLKSGDAGQRRQMAADMLEIVDYYREIYGILSQYAQAQTQDSLLHREIVNADDAIGAASDSFRKMKDRDGAELETEMCGLAVQTDRVMLDCLIDSLVRRSVAEGNDRLRLAARADGRFVRFELHRRGRDYTDEQLDGLFSPLMNVDDMAYVLCRQIIREHDESFSHPGCRINAQQEDGGTVVWFTLPAAD